MSYPDVVNSSSKPSPQVPVNVTQRSQVSSAVLIENEAGIRRGHVNSIASMFGQQQSSPVSKSSSRRRTSVKSSGRPGSSGTQTSRIPVVPKETMVYQSQTHASQSSARSNPAESAKSSGQPVPWPKPSSSQLKPVKSFGKSDSDLYASSTGIDSRGPRHPNDSTQPTIVFNKTRHIPRETRSTERSSRHADKTTVQGVEPPSGVRVGRWTVYETLPFKDGSGLNRDREDSKQRERDAQQKREADEWKRREAMERERMAEAERRKEEYDRKHREEMDAQERRQREELAAAQETQRREELEREREESRRRAEEDRRRRNEVEEQERRRKLEAEYEREMERSREREREENERRLREAREKRRIEIQQEEEERQLEAERRRREEREREYDRKLQQERERLRLEERMREEETRRRMKEENEMRDSTPDVCTAEEWTVFETVPVSSTEMPHLNAVRAEPSESSPYFQGSSSTAGYRRFLGDDRDQGRVDRSGDGHESEYIRNLRRIKENRRQQDEENEEQARRRSRDTERQEMHHRREVRRGDDVKRPSEDAAKFREGMEQWSALTEAEPIASGSAVGYRRFLDNDGTSGGDRAEDNRRQQESDARNHQEAEEERQRRDAEERRLREAEERNRREAENERRRREQLEVERRRRREVESMRREEERKRREAEEERHRREFEESNRRRHDEEERRRHDRDSQRSGFDTWTSYDPLDPNRGRLNGSSRHPDFFSRDEWTTFESVPVKEAYVSQSALRRNASQESIVGYRRLLDESSNSPDDNNSRSRSYEKNTHTRFRIGDDDSGGRNSRTETSTRSTRHNPSQAPPKSAPDEDARFEEWTEYHSVPAQFNVPDQSSTIQRYGASEPSRRRHTRYGSDDGGKAQPTFEEWTVVHNVPMPPSESATAYDVTDASAIEAGGRGPTSSKRRPGDDRYARDSERRSADHKRRDLDGKRLTQATDDLSLIGSDEEIPVEEIMPRRRDAGDRKRDVLVAAALRQLGASDDYEQGSSRRSYGRRSNYPSSATELPHGGDHRAVEVEDYEVVNRQARRLSPYHSYQRIHGGHQGRPSQGSQVATSADNGNVFHDRFNVSRENPAYYFHH